MSEATQAKTAPRKRGRPPSNFMLNLTEDQARELRDVKSSSPTASGDNLSLHVGYVRSSNTYRWVCFATEDFVIRTIREVDVKLGTSLRGRPVVFGDTSERLTVVQYGYLAAKWSDRLAAYVSEFARKTSAKRQVAADESVVQEVRDVWVLRYWQSRGVIATRSVVGIKGGEPAWALIVIDGKVQRVPVHELRFDQDSAVAEFNRLKVKEVERLTAVEYREIPGEPQADAVDDDLSFIP